MHTYNVVVDVEGNIVLFTLLVNIPVDVVSFVDLIAKSYATFHR